MKENNIILDKSKAFAVRIIKLYKYLCDDKKEFTLSKQLLRSGTSIGANVKEAIRGQSKPDFISKMSIALKEASETEYWIEMLAGCNAITSDTAQNLLQKCGIIRRMLSKSITTAKANLNEGHSKN